LAVIFRSSFFLNISGSFLSFDLRFAVFGLGFMVANHEACQSGGK
jgi:hypothetical protein